MREFKCWKLCWIAGKEICLTKYFPFELVLFFPQETSWRVKQYSSTLLTNYRIHLCPMGKGRHSVHNSKILFKKCPSKHSNDVLFILTVYCFPPTHLKYFTIWLIWALSKHISSLREVYLPCLLQSWLVKAVFWPLAIAALWHRPCISD